MFRCLTFRAAVPICRSVIRSQGELFRPPQVCNQVKSYGHRAHSLPPHGVGILQNCNIVQHNKPLTYGQTASTQRLTLAQQCVRNFHAKNSKVRYLDFRYRFRTSHKKSHLLIVRRVKMKKHQRRKWRKKFKCLLAKKRLKREIAKEKSFRVELLTMIKRAEQFDPREYALRKINEANNVKREPTKEERLEELKELIRVNRYQVDYIKPKHKRIQTLEDLR